MVAALAMMATALAGRQRIQRTPDE